MCFKVKICSECNHQSVKDKETSPKPTYLEDNFEISFDYKEDYKYGSRPFRKITCKHCRNKQLNVQEKSTKVLNQITPVESPSSFINDDNNNGEKIILSEKQIDNSFIGMKIQNYFTRLKEAEDSLLIDENFLNSEQEGKLI